ncbi:MAG TPA: DUF2784 domain-containing protein [Verrucomicrobiae bacterium]|nr:DUF2784 domain-containing protein [Verrucomicrobiae bacterium]
MRALYSIIADSILVAHALVVLFLVGSLPLIWLGYFRKWRFVRNFGFRVSHLLLMAFVAGEALVGAVCPLTSWENLWLERAGAGPRYRRGYIAYWLHQLIFYDLDERVFILVYLVFLAFVVFTFVRVKPQMKKRGAWQAGEK